MLEIATEKDLDKRDAEVEDTRLAMLAALVIGWSFDNPCTEAEIKRLFREAPQIAEQSTAQLRPRPFFREQLEGLFAHARRVFELERVPKGSKVSLRKHLQQVQKTTGKVPRQLAEVPELPESAAYIWHWFWELKGSQPLTYTEIKNWSELTATPLTPFEVQALVELDRRFIAVHGVPMI